MPQIKMRQSPIPLILLIVVQVCCAVFFLWDVFEDYRESGNAIIWGSELVAETMAVFGLFAAIIFEVWYLRRLLLRHTHLQASLSVAASAMYDIITDLFEQWKLTTTEKDVAMLMIKGFSISEIAKIRRSAEGTIKVHLSSIYRKSGTSGRAEVLSLLIDPLMAISLLQLEADKRETV